MQRPLFFADWMEVVFIHYRVAPDALEVPFDLDLHDGAAYVSLVAFTMRRMRTARLPALGRLALRPLSEHSFLNVRTYVRPGGEPGIYFLSEWLNCRPAIPLGGLTYGLPYHHAQINYRNQNRVRLGGEVRARKGAIHYKGFAKGTELSLCEAGSRDAFLLERYAAFTAWRGLRRRFEIQHEPWAMAAVDLTEFHDTLSPLTGDWTRSAEPAGVHFSPGVPDVSMSAPSLAPSYENKPHYTRSRHRPDQSGPGLAV